MKKRILALLPALALLLSGCASLLERSYTVVEPYTDRYWDSAAEDTLRAESYHDLVNSLLMLVEQRSTEGVVRYYGEPGLDTYMLALAARREVLQETVLGSYLLQDITLRYTEETDHSTLTFALAYREDAADPEKLMILSDTQSLVDLLRVSVREGHTVLTARFFEKTAREDVSAAVESLWQELQQEDVTDSQADLPLPESTDETIPTPTDPLDPPQPPEGEGETPAPGEGQTAPQPPEPLPPCPWSIRFYPDQTAAEIVEILLTEG